MKRRAKPGFCWSPRREWRWLLHDRVALILIFGVPLFAFVVLTAVFSQPVIRGLGVVVVDADRSDTSRALVEQVAASPSLSIVERTGDLASAASAIRSGEAIAALYIPANFERDLKAERRPQVVGFYNQQYLTAAGIASSGLSDSLAAAAASAAAPCGAEAGAHRIARRRDDRAGQSADKLRPVPAARAAADRSSTWSSRSPAATRSAPNSAGAACAPGSHAPAAIRSSRSPASSRRCSQSSS